MDLYTFAKIARLNIAKHGLTDYVFRYHHSKIKFGLCNWTDKVISMSRTLVFLNDENECMQTLIHEIAHALTPGAGHGPVWARKCEELGIIPAITYDAPHRAVVRAKPKYTMVCPNGHTTARHRKTAGNWSCMKCDPTKYNPLFKME